jgi:serine/threonine-protein kinase
MPSDTVVPTVAGYPIGGEIGPCPGGTAHHTTRLPFHTPAVFRRLTADPFAPFDTLSAYLDRAAAAAVVSHPNLVAVLDAGAGDGEPFVVTEPADGSDLAALIADIGPMPALLAAEYIRQTAAGLAAVHGAGLTHGDVRPAHLTVGPLVPSSKPRPDGSPRYRPGPTAVVKVAEFGLVPRRAKAADWPHEWAAAADYLPPERFAAADPTPAGDVYQLGACLYFVLTGRPPKSGPLDQLRPDAPPELIALANELTAANPADRPTAQAAADRLEAIVSANRPAPTPPPLPAEDAEAISLDPPPAVQPTWLQPAPASDSVEEPYVPRSRPARQVSRQAIWLGVAAFVVMNLLAFAIWFFVFVRV